MNAQMRRIDLLCKLLGPLFIALIDGYSTKVAIIVNFAMNAGSVVIEYFAIARVYHKVPELQGSKKKSQQETSEAESSQDLGGSVKSAWQRLAALAKKSAQDFSLYFHHRAFLPSMAGAVLYLTVLSFAGQMVTYLLSVGYNSTQIGIARTFSVAFEVLATWTAPWLMGRIGPVRAGLWLSSWQVVMLVAGMAVFWIFEKDPFISASGLVVGTILSRLGLRGFDLCAQLIVQEVSGRLRNSPLIPGQCADGIIRKLKPKAAALSPLSKLRGRTPLSSSPMQRPLCSSAPTSSSGPRSYRSWPLRRRAWRTRFSSTYAEATFCIWTK